MSTKLKKTLLVVCFCAICCGFNFNVAAGKMPSAQLAELETMSKFLTLMNNYLTLTDKWKNMVSDEDTSIILAAQSIKEIYQEKGNVLDAIPELRKIHDKYQSKPIIKRAILFEIKNIYKDAQQYDKAIAITKEILKIK